MRKIILLFAAVFSISCIFYPNNLFSQQKENQRDNCVIAYYFHGDFRCATCHRLEEYSRGAIENNFKNELHSGKLIFKTVNVDKKDNKHFIKDYQLYAKSLIISLVKNGKEIKSKNLTKIWEYSRDKEKFYNYAKEEIAGYLEKINE